MKTFSALILALCLAGLSRASEAPLDGKQSFLKFTGHAFMHDFDGEAKRFSGSAQIDAAEPSLVTSATINIPTATMTTFESARDRNMLDWLHVAANPEMRFELTSVKAMKGDPASATRDKPVSFSVMGNFTLNKTTRPLRAEALGWREGNLLIVTGTTVIDTVAHGLPQIKQLFLTVGTNVDVSFRLVFDLPPELQKTAMH